jgi:hypothetical protein
MAALSGELMFFFHNRQQLLGVFFFFAASWNCTQRSVLLLFPMRSACHVTRHRKLWRAHLPQENKKFHEHRNCGLGELQAALTCVTTAGPLFARPIFGSFCERTRRISPASFTTTLHPQFFSCRPSPSLLQFPPNCLPNSLRKCRPCGYQTPKVRGQKVYFLLMPLIGSCRDL